MQDDEDYWVEANALIRSHGKGALEHAASKVTELMRAGEDAEMLHWFEIHERVEERLAETPTWPVD